MKKYVVSSYPFIHSGNDVNKMFLYVTMSLVLPAVYGFLFFGVNTLLIVVASIISCYLFETLYNVINKGTFFVNNFSFFVTAMILALTMPVYTPIYIVIAAAFFAIFVTKMVFGGLGKNKFNPALMGRCFAGIMTSDMAVKFYNYSINVEVFTSFTSGVTN
ncbi:MAG: RnfABCDGE type electron transport complex subunit D [Clostridia bacterium]|nr:RnfABCDGE type electron transport complex subunit D [Clostridia bacterium]